MDTAVQWVGVRPPDKTCCHDGPSFGFPGNRPKVPLAGKETVGVGRAATHGCSGDQVGREPLGEWEGPRAPSPRRAGAEEPRVSQSACWRSLGAGAESQRWAPPLPRPRLWGHSPEVTAA